MPRKKTEEQMVQDIYAVQGDKIKYLGGFVNMCTKCRWRCINGHEIEVRPDSLQSGHECHICSHQKVGAKIKNTKEEIQKILFDKFGDKINLIGEYKNENTKTKFRCNVLNIEFDRLPSAMFRKDNSCKNCTTCKFVRKLNAHEVALRIHEASGGTLELLEDTFVNTSTKATVHCKNCGRYYDVYTPSIYIEKKLCAKCKHVLLLTYEEAKEKVDAVSGGTLYFYKEDYKNTHSKIPVHCLKCDSHFTSTIDSMAHGHGCARCVKKSLETPVIDILTKKQVDFDHDRGLEGSNFNGSRVPLRADFRFKKYPIIIETDGKQHFKEAHEHDFSDIYARDLHKNKWCKEHGYILIRVTSSSTHEWGTEKHITLKELLDLIEKYITEDGIVDVDVFRKYDFNRE